MDHCRPENRSLTGVATVTEGGGAWQTVNLKEGTKVMYFVSFYLFLYVLQQEGGGSQIVHWDVEEALNLFLVEVHGDQVGETYTNMVNLTVSDTMFYFNDSLCMYIFF